MESAPLTANDPSLFLEAGGKALLDCSRQCKQRDKKVLNYGITRTARNVRAAFVGAFLTLGAAAAACAAAEMGVKPDAPEVEHHTEALPHVIVISLDTTRADHFGCYGSERVKTPRLDAFAAESILFEDCMTAVPTTLASHVTMFSGKYPHTHGVPRNGFLVSGENVMLAETLKQHGYHTAAFPASFALNGRFNLSQGFDYYDDGYQDASGRGSAVRNQRRAADITRTVLEYLDKTPIEQPWFLFVHYYDPHAPYDPPGSYRTMYRTDHAAQMSAGSGKDWRNRQHQSLNARLPDAYAGEVSYMDEHVGRLLDGLGARGILDNALVLLASDHGETLLDHAPNFEHGYTVYEDTMHIVCMFRLPGCEKGGTRVSGNVSNVDFLPTILRFLELSLPDGVEGVAIDLRAETVTSPHERVFGQATKPYDSVEAGEPWPNMRKARVVREADLTFIQTPFANQEELYDLSRDPHQRRNLNGEKRWRSKAAALRDHLETWAASAKPLPTHFEQGRAEETLERLEALGYLE